VAATQEHSLSYANRKKMRVKSHDELKLGKAKQFRDEEGHLQVF